MTRQTLSLTQPLYDYILNHTLREPEILKRLRLETEPYKEASCQISPEQGQFMALLASLVGTRKALEIGVFTGYSALWVALALPDDGQLVACDVNADWTKVAKRYWQEAGVLEKIDLRLAPAAETLQALVDAGQVETFDYAFIDADKQAYDQYYEYCLQLVRPGGLILLDNMLMSGAVLDTDPGWDGTLALQALNRKIHADMRVEQILLPISDGVTLVRKC